MMPDISISGHLPWRVSDAASKVSAITNHCFYQIAMGRWSPGSKLPAIRQLEQDWSVNRLTILKAYSALAARGLVDHKPNGGYFVAQQSPRPKFTRDRIELNDLYHSVVARISDETELYPLGVLRMLVRIAESELTDKPDVAFVECSRSQAGDHAREITERLRIPILPLALDEIRGRKMRLPTHVKVVFTTSFHFDELVNLRDGGIEVIALPIQLSQEFLSKIAGRTRSLVFLETDDMLAQRTVKDAKWMMGIDEPRVEVAPVFDSFFAARLRAHDGVESETLFAIPQKEWETLDAKWREHPSVIPITCALNETAWELIAEAIKIPFGAAG